MTKAYVSASVEDELWVKQLRNNLWNIVGGNEFYRKISPHITVIPPFTIDDEDEEVISDIVSSYDISGREVGVDTLGVYKNIIEPYVVALYIDLELETVRNQLLDELTGIANSNIPEPVEPHITLLKAQDWRDDVDKDVKRNIQHEIIHRTSFKDTQIDSMDVVFKEQ